MKKSKCITHNTSHNTHFRVFDHLCRLLSTWHDLKTEDGARRRAKRVFNTATTIERWDGEGYPYHNPDKNPTLTFNVYSCL